MNQKEGDHLSATFRERGHFQDHSELIGKRQPLQVAHPNGKPPERPNRSGKNQRKQQIDASHPAHHAGAGNIQPKSGKGKKYGADGHQETKKEKEPSLLHR